MVAIPQVITEDRASGAQVVEGSLKFDGGYLKRTPSSIGNRQTWTWSAWVKRSNDSTTNTTLFSADGGGGSDFVTIRFEGNDLRVDTQGDGQSRVQVNTSAVYRDTGWYHIVVALDTTQANAAYRCRIYVNSTLQSTSNTLTQNKNFAINEPVSHELGRRADGDNDPFDGLMSQVYQIDGQALGPGYFGFTDPLTGVWRPKRFKAEGTTVNNGTVWSDLISAGGYVNSCGPTKAFDGSIDSSDQTDGCKPADDDTATLTLGTTIHGKIRVYFHRSGSGNVDSDIVVDGIGVGSNVNSTGWYELPVDSLRTLSWKHRSGVVGYSLQAIEVDGVIMTDNTTQNLQFGINGFYLPMDGNSPIGEDKSGAPSLNDGTVWSSYFTGNHDSTHGWGDLYESANAFDGDLSSAAIGQVSATGLTWTAPGGAIGADATTIRIYGNDDACPDDYLKINGINYGGLITQGFGPDWTVLKGPGAVGGGITQLESVYLRDNSSGNTHYRWRALEIDGVVLVDGKKGNNWTPVGFGGSVELSKATGAIPIHNTNDAGTVAKNGVRNDAKTYTVTASGGNYYLDGALKPTLNAVRGGSYTFDYTGATSHPLYLSSLPDGKHDSKAYSVQFDGNGDYLSATGTGTLAASSDWCMECFFYCTGNEGGTYRIMSANEASQSSEYLLMRIRLGQYQFSTDTANSGTINTAVFNEWTHMALTKSGTTVRGFINGKKIWETTDNNTVTTTNLIIGWGYASEYFPGYISNARFVNGSSVYTADFTPPTTSLTNITNTHLLCCQDSNAATGIIASGSITAAGNAAASQTKQPFLYNSNGDLGVNTGTSNTTKITIPHTAADTLYYYCNVHSGMGSSINVTTDIFKADPYAWKCFLACPYAGDEFDVSDQINCNSTASAATNWNSVQGSNGATFYNTARYFAAGGGKNINYAGKQEFNFTGNYRAFTIEFFATPSSGSSDGAPISSKGYYSNYGNWYLRLATTNGGRMNFYSYDGQSNGQNNEFQNLGCTDPNRVHHVVVQRDENNLMTFMLDGVIVGKASNVTRALDDGSQSGLTVGRIPSNNTTNSAHNWYLGYITDLRIYSGLAKYSGSVGDHVFTPPSVTPDVLPDTPSGITGKTNLTKITEGAVYFDGSGDYLDPPTSSDFGLASGDNFTIECFVFTSAGNQELIRQGTANAASDGMYFSITSSGALETRISGTTKTTSGKISFNSWNHISVCRSGGTLYMSINGVVESHGSVANSSTTGDFRIGANFEGNSFFTGHISNVRFVKGTALYTSNFTPPTERLTEVTNTKLLCCQSTTSASAAAVAPNLDTYTVRDNNGGTHWSGASLSNATLLGNLFDGDNSTSCQQSTNGTAASITNFGPVNVSSTVSFYSPDGDARYTLNGGSEVSVSGTGWHDISFSGTLTSFTFQAPGNARIFIYGMKIDGVELVDIITSNGNAAATNFNPLTDDINAIRGQESGYCSYNPLNITSSVILKDGNLQVDHSGTPQMQCTVGNVFASTGKYYAEITKLESGVEDAYGIVTDAYQQDNSFYSAEKISAYRGGHVAYSGMSAGKFPAFNAAGQVLGLYMDLDNQRFGISLNGGPASFVNIGDYDGHTAGERWTWMSQSGSLGSNGSFRHTANFGQKPFKFPPPDGFQPLNLSTVQPEKVIARPDQYVGTSLYTGNGGTLSVTNLNFKPDLVWIKCRSHSDDYTLTDSVRGADRALYSNNANQENVSSIRLQSFNNDGFTTGSSGDTNTSGRTFCAWTWKAGGNKNTFNIDDVGYANASDVNMNVGAFNNYNTSRMWSNGIANSNSDFDQAKTNAFNGDRSNKLRTGGNAVLVTMNFSPALTVANTIQILGEDYATANFRYTVTVDGTTTTKDVDQGQPATFNVSGSLTQITFVNNNSNGRTYLEWIKVDGQELIDSNVTINTPSIAPTGCSVGTKQGFSIIKYTSNLTQGATIPHGLTQKPDFAIFKNIDSTLGTNEVDWGVYHSALGATKNLELNQNLAEGTNPGPFNNTEPTSSVFTFGGSPNAFGHSYLTNGPSGDDFIAYIWHDVPGLQKFGSYINPSSSDGAFVELGFKPAVLIYKCARNISSSSGAGDWMIIDTTRSPVNNPSDMNNLSLNVSNGEDSYYSASQGAVDILSNGFKIRHPNSSPGGDPGRLYIYAAWAEAPGMNLYGAQANAR